MRKLSLDRTMFGRSLERKLTAILMIVSSVVVLAMAASIVTFLMRQYHRRLVEELLSNTEMVAVNCAAAVQFEDPHDAQELLKALSARPPIAYACIQMGSGEVLAAYRRAGFDAAPEPMPEMGTHVSKKGWIVAARPVVVSRQAIGSVYIQSDLDELASFRRYSITIVAVVLPIILLVAYLLSKLLQRVISLPIQRLTQVSREVSETQNYALRVDLVGDDELGRLAHAFDEMLNEVQRSNRALKHAKSYITGIINSMPSMLIGVDRNGVITNWNDEAAEVTGVERATAVGQPLNTVLPGMDSDEAGIDAALSRGGRQYLQRTVKTKGEWERYEEISIYPLAAEGVEGAVIRVDNVTERRRLEEALQHAQRMDALGMLAGGIAHDFNNVLGGILALAELIEMSEDEASKSRQFAGQIKTVVERAAALTQKLLNFGRKGSKKMDPVDVHDIINDTAALLENTIDKRIEIKTAFSAESAFVKCDASQFQNVMLNLGINASHAMKEGGVLSLQTSSTFMDAEACRESPFDLTSGPFLLIQVEDTGCGIPDEIKHRIFEPFFTTKSQGEGSGLGLAAAYGTVVQCGGQISVDSVPEQGTTFTILLPLSDEKVDQAEAARVPVSLKGKGTILLVDDEEVVRVATEERLKSCGYEVLLASDGMEAVACYRQRGEDVDLVICDMMMPRMNGRDCFKALKEINPDVRLVVSTGFASDEDLNEMHRMGAAGQIIKPYTFSQLSSVIQKVLG